MNIHFICRGNVLRSFIAETYLRSLNIPNLHTASSGTNVNWDDPTEREYFNNTLAIFERHNLTAHAKPQPQQLTPARTAQSDYIVFMNQRVIDEARNIIPIPNTALNWNIVDIGEGHRTDAASRERYEEEIYQEITQKVDELVAQISTNE